MLESAVMSSLWSSLFAPKSDIFAMFVEQAKLAHRGAVLLGAFMADTSDAENKARAIQAIEHDADQVTRRLVTTLHKTFITPIDRGDIHRLASRLDDVMDYIEAAAQRLWLYEIREATPEATAVFRSAIASPTTWLFGIESSLAVPGRSPTGSFETLTTAVRSMRSKTARLPAAND